MLKRICYYVLFACIMFLVYALFVFFFLEGHCIDVRATSYGVGVCGGMYMAYIIEKRLL